METTQKRYGQWLLLPLLLFMARVFIQLTQYLFQLSFLPDFDAWQSGVLPYSVLLIFQISIMTFMLVATLKFFKGRIVPNHTKGRVYWALGAGYFFFMLFRFIAGFTFAGADSWFHAPIPSFFHMVLASFVIIMGRYHKQYAHEHIWRKKNE